MRRCALLLGLALCISSTAVAGAEKATADTSSAPAKAQPQAKKKKKKKKRVATFRGHGASKLRSEPLDKPSGNVWLYVENLKEEVRVNIYKTDGGFNDESLAKLDELFRCVRSGEVRAVRPELYEQLSRFFDHFGEKRIDLISGFRFQERNSSRHYHASAMDIRIKGVSIREMYAFAESLDGGGMGIGLYPTSQFVHLDYRAPGEPSYRWTDTSGPGETAVKAKKKKKKTGRTQPARKPTS